jgi:putative adenylate-forming enzyme
MKFKLKIIWYWLKLLFSSNLNSREGIEAFHTQKLHQFAKNTLPKSKYYQKYFRNNKFDWESVSQISKLEFMTEFDDINTKGIKLTEAMEVAIKSEKTRDFKSEIKGITVGLSTGTSGKRGLFLVSESERAQWVALVMKRVLKPKLFRKQKIAFFLRANSKLYSSVSSSMFEFIYFDIFRPIDELISELNACKPHILVSPPSILLDIAQAQQIGRINIRPIQIISCAEVLHPNDKKIISTTFKVQIGEVYQCMEGFLGASCEFGTMHLNEDFIHFEKEWIEDDKFHPIITDFSRTSQPVVKYKLNDVLQLKKEACKCGSPFMAIEKIIGRDDDVLIFNGKRIYPDIIARKIALHTDDFQKYMITQVGPTTLRVIIEGPNYEACKKAFQTTLEGIFNDFDIQNVNYLFQNKVAIVQGNKTRKINRIPYES